MTNKTEGFRQNESLPPLNNAQIIVVIPFYNEEQTLPGFIQSLRAGSTPADKVYIVGVNHRSNDRSEQTFIQTTSGYCTSVIVQEKQELASVGVPRQRGLGIALDLAQTATKEVVIGSIDTDSRVSPHFLEEAERFLGSDHDFLLFPTRNDQEQFLNCVAAQSEADAAVGALFTLVGVDWLKYQLRALLLKAGAIETRGSGGYFFTADGYAKAHGHKPVYAADGTIVTGESNAVGIRAKRNGATALISPYHNTASPRRIFKSLRTANEGYKLTSSGKTFETVDTNRTMPILDAEQWQQQFKNMVYGAIRTFVIKALAYEIVPTLQNRILIAELNELLKIAEILYSQTPFEGDERDAIGSQTYISLFERAYAKLGEEKQQLLFRNIVDTIPNTKDLKEWATDSAAIIEPINQLG